MDAAAEKVSDKIKDDIRFARDNVRKFAETQMETLADAEVEIFPGLIAGQKSIPCQAAGCYVPGGRYSQSASLPALATLQVLRLPGASRRAATTSP